MKDILENKSLKVNPFASLTSYVREDVPRVLINLDKVALYTEEIVEIEKAVDNAYLISTISSSDLIERCFTQALINSTLTYAFTYSLSICKSSAMKLTFSAL